MRGNVQSEEVIELGGGFWAFVVCGALMLLWLAPLAILPEPAVVGTRRAYQYTPYAGGSVGGTLRTLMSAQVQFQSQAVIDEDADGVGEYGLLGDLAGATLRNGGPPCNPTFVSPGLRPDTETGFARKSGFHYRSYVPANVNLAEQRFVVLAWPTERGRSGFNTYLLTEEMEIYVWVDAEPFTGNQAPTLDDVFFGAPWVTPINTWSWRQCKN